MKTRQSVLTQFAVLLRSHWWPFAAEEPRAAKTGLVLSLGVAVLFLYAGCNRLTNPTTPTGAAVADQGTSAWAPCAVVHNPGGTPFKAQMDAVSKLQRAGKMLWIRLDAHLNGSGVEYHREARRMGLRTMSIIAVKDLESAGWESAFDRIYAMYPTDIWQIGNEISNPDPNVNPVTVTPAYYMSKFSNLYGYVKSRYPGVMLAGASTFGTGLSGASELESLFKFGLLDMDVVVTLNVYSHPALSSYATVLDKYAARLAGKRIWVTETGSSNPASQIAWVQEFYPRLFNVVHPEMICWYALWGGDAAAGDNGFGLLDHVESGDVVERPLFRVLAGEQ
ncbi:MAG: hypothetical protein ABMA15_20060 [Vicinamibacterales bacterium]